jgi:hypothetical protein
VSKDTESQHSEASPHPTPGPWEWKTPPWSGRKWLVPASKDLEALPVDPDYRPILDSDPSGGEYFPAIDPESPNGRLITAAPDLLAALKEILDDYSGPGTLDSAGMWARAFIAFAKAEGRDAE